MQRRRAGASPARPSSRRTRRSRWRSTLHAVRRARSRASAPGRRSAPGAPHENQCSRRPSPAGLMTAKPPSPGRSPQISAFSFSSTPRPCGEMTSGIEAVCADRQKQPRRPAHAVVRDVVDQAGLGVREGLRRGVLRARDGDEDERQDRHDQPTSCANGRNPTAKMGLWQPLRLIDLHFGGREHAIGVYVVETDDGLALFDCGPTSTLPALHDGPRRARARADGHPPPAALAHPPRPRRAPRASIVREHPGLTVWVSDVGAPASDRPVEARALGAPALRRALRPALGRARGRSRSERARSRTATCSAGRRSRPAATQRTTSATSATARCSRETPPACGCRARGTSCRSRRRPTSTSRRGTRRSRRSATRDPERLALIHFGVHEDVAVAPRPARGRARSLGRARARRDGSGGVRRGGARRRGRRRRRRTTESRRSGSRGTASSATGTPGTRR